MIFKLKPYRSLKIIIIDESKKTMIGKPPINGRLRTRKELLKGELAPHT